MSTAERSAVTMRGPSFQGSHESAVGGIGHGFHRLRHQHPGHHRAGQSLAISWPLQGSPEGSRSLSFALVIAWPGPGQSL